MKMVGGQINLKFSVSETLQWILKITSSLQILIEL
jgi:hypothetical protein